MNSSRRTVTKILAGGALAALLGVPASAKSKFNFTAEKPRAPKKRPTRISRNSDAPTKQRRRYRGKRIIKNPTGEGPGTIVVSTRKRKLYLVLDDGNAIEYGVGVGRAGFTWSGTARIARKAEWPAWHPPKEMIEREKKLYGRTLPARMEGGINNPLGARALYLYQGNKDTLYRIHGTNAPQTIGRALSSGCIRMLNDEVVDLYERTKINAKVVVT